MKKNMSKVLVLLLSLIMVVGLAGCGGDKGGDTAGKTSIVIATDQDYSTLHNADTSSTIENTLTQQIYDTLFQASYEDSTQLEPRLAKEYSVDDSGKCYTFVLRDDVTWHDGSAFTAADVAFTLDQYAASEYQGAVVDGFDKYEIVDDYTIKVYTKDVYAPFLHSVATDMNIGCKAYSEAVDAETFAQQPIGCGPYKWVSHEIGDKVTLQAYEGYYRGEAPIKDVTYKVISDVASMGMALQTGEIDFAEIDASIKSTLEAAEGIQLLDAQQTTFAFVAMNTEKEPYNNVKFRQAINYAMDRESMLASIQEGMGTANSNLLTPGRNGYSEDQIQYAYDVDKAKALLAEAGVAEGTDLGKLYVAEQYKLMAQMVQANLEAIGLKTEIEILEFNAYLDKLMKGETGITCLQMSLEGDTQQMSMAVCTDYIGMANNARYSNPDIDAAFEKAAKTVDDAERTAIYEDIFAQIQEEAVYAVLYNPTMLFAANEGLSVHTLPLEGMYHVYDFAW